MQSKKFDVKVGQTVYLYPYGNAKYRYKENKAIQATVTKVARKYFYVMRDGFSRACMEEAFNLDDFSYYDKQQSNGGYYIFPDKESLCEELAHDAMRREIFHYFSSPLKDLTHSQVKQIYDILIIPDKEDLPEVQKVYEMEKKYTPLLQAVLNEIHRKLDVAYWNKNQEEMASPFDNTGSYYVNPTFSVCAYQWDEEGSESDVPTPNFVWQDVKVYWYKHSNRGLSAFANREITPELLSEMLNDCLNSLIVSEE